MDIKFTVKELSKIVGVSSRNIRYYDDIGLFKCSGILDNGYRYYHIDKIEEIGIINYLRHMGVPIKDIKTQLKNRDINEYENLLDRQLDKVSREISKLERVKYTIKKRQASLDFLRSLPELGQIHVKKFEEKRIIKLKRQLKSQLDWELALNEIESKAANFPSIFIGDLGFFVDMTKVKTRKSEEFSAMFLLADSHLYHDIKDISYIDEGNFLSLYIQGDHHEASAYYDSMIKYAKKNKLTLADYALERTLIDHYISSDEDLHITEILIAII